jgi:DNA end-binding protein Ku
MPKTQHKRARKAVEPHQSKWGSGQFWSGTISFGLVSVPVQLFPAQRQAGVHLRMFDSDGAPVQRRYFCPKEGRLVPASQIVRGYELKGGNYVVVTDEELEAAEPKKSREIDLQRFVDRREVSPLYFERAYYLTPRGDSSKAYRLLAEAIMRTGRAGIATFVMRDREYLVAIVAEKGILLAHTLRFSDEIRDPRDLDLPLAEKADRNKVQRYKRAIAKLETDTVDLAGYVDEEAERLRKLVDKKRERGQDLIELDGELAAADHDGAGDDGEEEVDLLETIRRSLQGAKPSRPKISNNRDLAPAVKTKKKTSATRKATPAKKRG